MGLFTCIMIIAIPKRIPTTTSAQGMSPPTMPCANVAIKPDWDCRKLPVSKSDAPSIDIGLVEQHQGPIHDHARDHDSDQFSDLNFARRSSEDVSNFEILKQFARYRGGNANHRRDTQHCRHAGWSRDAQGHHQQRSNQ